MDVSNVRSTPLHDFDSDQSKPEVLGRERPDRSPEIILPARTASTEIDSGLTSRTAPDGADPKLWEMLGPAERAYLSGGFDRISYGQGSDGSGLVRGAYVDIRV